MRWGWSCIFCTGRNGRWRFEGDGMSIILGLAVSAALTGATPMGSPGRWLTDQDYPPDARRRREQGAVAFTLLISPNGMPLKCNVTRSSNFDDLDKQSCTLLMRRARFTPARDIDGNAAHTYYRGFMYWSFSRPTPLVYAPDIDLQVDKLPGGAKEKTVSILVQTDLDGHVVACNLAKSEDNEPKNLVAVACKEAATMSPMPVRDGDGRSVTAVRPLKVSFATALP
ncbi:hypothetical protein BSY17_2148 [Sphingobium sp. RAC03]|jgi:TonB family protein|nr:hypothetical protein BSY17_2148 [Sphingobium sp. RAC03]